MNGEEEEEEDTLNKNNSKKQQFRKDYQAYLEEQSDCEKIKLEKKTRESASTERVCVCVIE